MSGNVILYVLPILAFAIRASTDIRSISSSICCLSITLFGTATKRILCFGCLTHLLFLFYSETKRARISDNFLFKLATLISLTFHRKNNRTTSITRLKTMFLGRILSRLLNASVITNGNAVIVRSIHVISFFL